jgi:CRP-like cAMP-binding protein
MFSMRAPRDGKIERLRQLDLFSHSTALQLRHVARSGELVRVASGCAIHPDAAPLHWCYLIVSGRARAGTQVLSAGQVYGDAQILARDRGAAPALVADGDVEVLAIPKAGFVELLREVPDLAVALTRSMAQRLVVPVTNPRLAAVSVS